MKPWLRYSEMTAPLAPWGGRGDGSTATKGNGLGTGVTDCQAVKCCCVTEWLMAVLPTVTAEVLCECLGRAMVGSWLPF